LPDTWHLLEELGQMGLWPEHISHTERYTVAREWVHALKRLWQEERVTFHGNYITSLAIPT
jgi:pyrimidine oxygenase